MSVKGIDLALWASQVWSNPTGSPTPPISLTSIASATTIAPTSPVTTVTGTTTVSTITPPWTEFLGWITILAPSALPFDTNGNVQSAFTATAGRAVHLFYDGSKWWPGHKA